MRPPIRSSKPIALTASARYPVNGKEPLLAPCCAELDAPGPSWEPSGTHRLTAAEK